MVFYGGVDRLSVTGFDHSQSCLNSTQLKHLAAGCQSGLTIFRFYWRSMDLGLKKVFSLGG